MEPVPILENNDIMVTLDFNMLQTQLFYRTLWLFSKTCETETLESIET